MTTPLIDPALLAKLQDPAVASAIKELLGQVDNGGELPVSYAPFYVNKHGKYTKGHPEIELQRENLELKPIYEDEAIKLGLMTAKEVETFKNEKAASTADKPKDLNEVSDEEMKELQARAKELAVPNWHLMKAARLKGEIKKAELKKEQEGEE